jgi:HEAT repeat protein
MPKRQWYVRSLAQVCKNLDFRGGFARMGLLSEVRLERTLQVLSSTANDAAADVLLEALVHAEPRWQPRVLEALLQRRSEVAGSVILGRWRHLGSHQRQLVARRRGWISDTLRNAFAAPAGESFCGACLAAREIGDYAQIPHLVSVVLQNPSPKISQLASQTVLQLADRFRAEWNRYRDYQIRRGPQLQRSHALSSLERGVRNFQQHGCRELIEALLLMVDRRNATIAQILRDPSDRAFGPLLDLLVTSARPAIMELLLDFLDDSQTPLSAMHAAMRRRDAKFVRLLCRKIGGAPSAIVRENLKRLDNIPLMRQPSALLQMLDPTQQPGAVQLAVCANISQQQKLEFIDRILQEGSIPARRCAADMLAYLSGADANAVVLRTLSDDDGEVKASVIRQLRQREIPDALTLLVCHLDAPQPTVREAARESLADITFDRFLNAYDQWDDETRSNEGQLALQVDPQFIGKLVMELLSLSRTHQRRALEITQLLGLGHRVEPALTELASDEDQYVRLEAVRLLASLGTPLAQETLRVAQHDKSALVQEAARQGLPELPVAGGPAPDAGPERSLAAGALTGMSAN